MALAVYFRKYSFIVLILVAVFLAGLAGVISVSYLDKKELEIKKRIEGQANFKSIIVATKNLMPGDVLSNENLSLYQVPERYIADGALTDSDFEFIAGAVVNQPVSYGKPLLRNHIHGVSSISSFSELIPLGYRAMTLEISELESNENMLVVGDRVDILVVNSNSAEAGSTISPLLDNVKILATGTTTIANPFQAGNGYSSVTIAVEEKMIPSVLKGKESGKLVYLLRNSKDEEKSRYRSVEGEKNGVNTVEIITPKNATNGLIKPSTFVTEVDQLKSYEYENSTHRLYQKARPEADNK